MSETCASRRPFVSNEQTIVSVAEPQWYAVYTASHHEKAVATHLNQRSVEHFLPLYRSIRHWQHRAKLTLELPLFPNYIFVHINRGDRMRVLEVPGVLSIVGSGNKPAPLPKFEIESLRADLHLRQIEPHPYLVIGERVRIRIGAMAGMTGVLVRKKSNLRVVLSLDQIMQSVAVEVDGEDLEIVADNSLSVSRC